ncbi:hypothetical protein C8J56DRAFT_565890 [Mycena floridula]|nr:hypothetical protein C8J56DRAFT_565890 [Mycena floridula]
MDAPPAAEALKNASDIDVLDANGSKVKFGSLFADQKTVVVFIRHFFCGSCQMYVEDLAEAQNSTPENLAIPIVVIGCGEPDLINFYAEKTGFKGPIYAEPTTKLLKSLGMEVSTVKGTPAGEKRSSYLKKGPLANALSSTWTIFMNIRLLGKQGSFSQLGGEFVLGPGAQCTMAHRMQHTEDHIDVADLMKAAGGN